LTTFNIDPNVVDVSLPDGFIDFLAIIQDPEGRTFREFDVTLKLKDGPPFSFTVPMSLAQENEFVGVFFFIRYYLFVVQIKR
jgi:hypothetical protein